MFTTTSIAARIERAEAGLTRDGVRAAGRRLPPGQLVLHELHGGVASYVEPGAPFNKAIGFGFDGVPDEERLAAIERDFADRSAPLQFEVSTLADPALVRTLTGRGYALVGFENVLGLPLAGMAAAVLPDGVEVALASADESPGWLETVATGFMTPDVFDGPASHEPPVPREVLDRVFGDTMAASGFEHYLARRDGTVAGGAGLRIQDGIAQLIGAATLPDHRRRGVQTALLRHRLARAASRGCDIAVVTTQPGSRSQANVQKAGFALLYARAVLVKELP